MSSETLKRREILQDSEATLREATSVLLEISAQDEPSGGNGASREAEGGGNGSSGSGSLGDMIGIFMKTYREIDGILDGIRKGRGILQKAAMDRVQKTHAKLEEVTMTTELAATDMLDGLDKALSLVDQILVPNEEGDGEPGPREEAGDDLRDELFRLITLLQFQDITAQQLAHASGVLAEVEERLEALTRLFDLHSLDPEDELLGLVPSEKLESDPSTFDPAASTEDSESRQALADEIFT